MASLFEKKNLSSNSGIGAIVEILDYIKQHFEVGLPKYYKELYPSPKVIFRGIDGIYDSKDIDDSKHSIDSSLSHRLRLSSNNSGDKEAFVKANYLSSLLSVLSESRKNCPEKYNNSCDLYILADLQHRGGATCLVDFSKNALVSLWFACNPVKYEGKYQDGVLYCYNYMNDIIVKNSLSIVHQTDERKSIQDLLYDTYTVIDYCSDSLNRFRIWDPVAINNRVVRQDSIFLFGIEKFYPHNHDILAIVIPHNLKLLIREVLERYFNITATTIFNDEVGLATANNKFKPFRNDTSSFIDRCYDNGFDSMLQGNYHEALELLTTYDIDKPQNVSIRKKIELCFSLAVCYKKLATKENYGIIYYRNAIQSYYSAIDLAKDMLSDRDSEMQTYYLRKTVRAYNEIIELHYHTGDYLSGIKCCSLTINALGKFMKIKGVTHIFDTKYIELTKVEFMLLHILDNYNSNVQSNIIEEYIAFAKDLNIRLNEKNGNIITNEFDKVLISRMCWMLMLIKYSLNHEDAQIDAICNFIMGHNLDKRTTQIRTKLQIETMHYREWDFSFLIDVINDCGNSLNASLRNLMLQLISHTIMIRDMFDAKARIVNKEF